MRLIDADELKLCYTGSDTNKASYLSIRKMIDTSKTTYDIDKVVEELKCENCESCRFLEVCAGSKWCGKCHERIIEIVKQDCVAVANNATNRDDVCERKTASEQYNKAIDDFADKIINLCDDGEFMNQFNEFPATTILEVVEQLKAGGADANNE